LRRAQSRSESASSARYPMTPQYGPLRQHHRVVHHHAAIREQSSGSATGIDRFRDSLAGLPDDGWLASPQPPRTGPFKAIHHASGSTVIPVVCPTQPPRGVQRFPSAPSQEQPIIELPQGDRVMGVCRVKQAVAASEAVEFVRGWLLANSSEARLHSEALRSRNHTFLHPKSSEICLSRTARLV